MADVDQNMRRIICLANSKKPGGRCLAGKLYSRGKFGRWMRPISGRMDEALSESERQVGKNWMGVGVEPALLDILEFSILSPRPTNHQVENWLINPRMYMLRMGQITPNELLPVIDNPNSLWTVGSSSSRGSSDFVPEERIHEAVESLYLIHPELLSLHVTTDEYMGRETRQVRGEFTYGGVIYNLKVTDPIVEAKYLATGDGIYKNVNALLTISLAEKIFVPKYNHSAGYYKLIAGVIEYTK